MNKKTDSAELEKIITIILGIIVLSMPVGFSLKLFGAIDVGHVEPGEIVLMIGGIILFIVDLIYVFRKENRLLTAFGIIIALYATSVIVSIVSAQNMNLAIAGNNMSNEGGLTIVAYLVLLFSASIVKKESNRFILYVCIVIFGLIQFIFGILQAVFHLEIMINDLTEEFIRNSRAFGTIKNPNPYGSVMVLLAGMEYGLFYCSDSRKRKLFHFMLAIAYTYCVVISGTRGSWIGLAGTLFLFCLTTVIIEKKQKKSVAKALKPVGMILIGLLIVLGGVFVTSKDSLVDVQNRTSIDLSAGKIGGERLDIWKQSFNSCFCEHPFLGVGIANVNIWLKNEYKVYTKENRVDYSTWTAEDAHNRYLNIMCTQGLFGIISYVLLIGFVLLVGVRKILKNGIQGQKELYGLIVAVVGYLIADFFCIAQIYMGTMFFVILGLLVTREDLKKIVARNKDNQLECD